jgi:hypothetical protein
VAWSERIITDSDMHRLLAGTRPRNHVLLRLL